VFCARWKLVVDVVIESGVGWRDSSVSSFFSDLRFDVIYLIDQTVGITLRSILWPNIVR
jgi:hypothetical protein